MALTTINSKWQVTVPKDVREELGLKVGDKIDFYVNDDGTARIIPASKSVEEVLEMLKPLKSDKHATVEEMNESIAKYFRKKYKK